jgi:site-specific recombinase XerD
MRIGDFFEDNYRPRKLRGRSQNTVRLYRSSIKNLEKTLGRQATLEDFTDETIALVMQTILDRGGSPFTANKERSQLLALWRYAAQTGLLTIWPTITPENEPERIPIAWLQEDIHQLIATIDRQTNSIGNIPAKMWWRGVVCICLDTGERIGAVAQCRWDWLEGSWLLVPAEARKGRKRDRRYLLSQETMRAIADVRPFSTRDGAIFPWPYCSTYLWTKFTKLLKEAGLPHGRKDKFHRLRKTLGSVVYAAGLDAQDILDHQNKRTTQAYLDPRFSRSVQPSQIIADWLRHPPTPTPKRKQA